MAVLSESGYMRRSTDLRMEKFRGLTCGCTQNACSVAVAVFMESLEVLRVQ